MTIHLETDIPGPRSRAVVERKQRVVPAALDLHVPVVIDRGHGASFTDLDGNVLLDFSGGLGPNLVGHSHPKVVEAVAEQVRRFSHTDFTVVPYEAWVDLSEALVARVGGDRKVALFNSGAEAVENAVKIARYATGRPAVIAFEGAFHGRTYMAMTLTSAHLPYKQRFGPFVPDVYRAPYPYPYRSPDPERCAADALAMLERAFVTHVDPATVAAVVVEPVLGEGGFVVPPADFLPGLEALCDRHGILTVADEVQTGCGRTGAFLASEHSGFEPDIVVLAKALGAGYPISAVVARSDVIDALGPGAIGGTYVGNPVACVAASAVLQVIDEEGLVDRAEQVGKTITSRWQDAQSSIPEIGEIRSLGSMVGVEFVTDRATKEPNPPMIKRIVAGALERGVVAVSCGIYKNVLRHLMPLVITDDELDEGLDVLVDAAAAARR